MDWVLRICKIVALVVVVDFASLSLSLSRSLSLFIIVMFLLSSVLSLFIRLCSSYSTCSAFSLNFFFLGVKLSFFYRAQIFIDSWTIYVLNFKSLQIVDPAKSWRGFFCLSVFWCHLCRRPSPLLAPSGIHQTRVYSRLSLKASSSKALLSALLQAVALALIQYEEGKKNSHVTTLNP
jgi:hypothetical protein